MKAATARKKAFLSFLWWTFTNFRRLRTWNQTSDSV